MINHIKPGKRLSGATVHNGLIYTSGQTPDDLTADVQGQSRQVLAKLDALLAAAGSDKSKILSAMVWVPDIAHRDEFNVVWDAWVAEPGPARACVESKLAAPGILVEVALVAAVATNTTN